MELHRYVFLLTVFVAVMADENLEELYHSGNMQFTSKMFSEILKNNPQKSIVVSAFSVMMPLAQLAVASSGPTHDEILNSMGLPNDNVTKAVFSQIDSELKSIQGVELKSANKIYIPLGYELNDEFAAVSRDVFNSEVANVDFIQNNATAKEINAWVEEKTNHRIRNLVDPRYLDEDTRGVLVNALYFYGTWMVPFQKMYTSDEDFHVSNDKTVKVPMMYKKANFKYVLSERLNSKILELPYIGGQSSMLIVLPNEVEGIEELKEKLNDLSILDEEVKNMRSRSVVVNIPKFKIETTTDLKEILKMMNIKELFSKGGARLTKLLKSPKPFYVSNVLQKAFIEVNEEGFEAAAATYVVTKVLKSANYKKFFANHPFIFFLKENNNILFSGAYYA